MKAPPYLTIGAELRRVPRPVGITVTNVLKCAIQLSGETRRWSRG